MNQVSLDDWTRCRNHGSLGTNAGADKLPFQTWHHFKEAFAPELVARAVAESGHKVRRCLDPFGGSGTTGLSCQFLGIHPVMIEVNPFLADLIEAKLAAYDTDALARELGSIVRRANEAVVEPEEIFANLPPTFIEPGVDGRWIFDQLVATRLAALLVAINHVADIKMRRFFLVLLAGILVKVSNVVVNGKGRRYRRGWSTRRRDPREADRLFCMAAQRAIGEIHRFAKRPCLSYDIYRGDCRLITAELEECDLAVFSPPYPNSFDYTDVYNLELWVLGYLTDRESNRTLRRSTFCSHVQLSREFPAVPRGSDRLKDVLSRMEEIRRDFWDPRIPNMIGGYFSDMMVILRNLHACMSSRGAAWLVLGDSRYVNVQIETAEIVADLAPQAGWRVVALEPCRSMRVSAQQGGRLELAESLLILSPT